MRSVAQILKAAHLADAPDHLTDRLYAAWEAKGSGEAVLSEAFYLLAESAAQLTGRPRPRSCWCRALRDGLPERDLVRNAMQLATRKAA